MRQFEILILVVALAALGSAAMAPGAEPLPVPPPRPSDPAAPLNHLHHMPGALADPERTAGRSTRAKTARAPSRGKTDNADDLPFEESLGKKDNLSDAPFDGPATSAAIGIGGGAGGSFGGRRRASTEGGVDLGLRWLEKHQHEDGGWRAPLAAHDAGTTGLALLAFLGAGESHKHGRFKKTVKKALKYLKRIQRPDGSFAAASPEADAIATLAMCEAYAITASPLFKQSSLNALHHLLSVRPLPNDASSYWAIMALASAKASGLRSVEEEHADARKWLAGGYAGWSVFPAMSSTACDSANTLGRFLLGEKPEAKPILDTGDQPALYFGMLAAFQAGGKTWKRWNQAVKPAIFEAQLREGDDRGSWDPVGISGSALGRVGATALMTLCLEVYYRYLRVFGVRDDAKDPVLK